MIGILGGTFDPIHNGHLHLAQSLYTQLKLEQVCFIPCEKPPLNKKAAATPAQRLHMLQLALARYPYFGIDQRELKRHTPSYMSDTLASLRQEYAQTPLVLILGSDNLEKLNLWHRWTTLIEYAHLVIVLRPGQANNYPPDVQTFIKQHQTQDSSQLSHQSAGLLWMSTVKPLPISSTAIRKAIGENRIPFGLLPDSVLNYILQQKLYL